MDLQIRRMEKEDIESCTELFIQAFAREPWKENHEALTVRTYYKNFMENPAFIGYVAEIGGKILAVCIGMSKPWMKGIEYYLDLLCVDWRWQGKGIGSLFLEKVQQELEKDGIHGVLLSTERTYPAYEFYKKNGFQEIEGIVLMGKE